MKNTATDSRVNETSLVSDLVKLLGEETVLLPIPRGRKGPTIRGWQHFTVEQMQQPEYLAQLNHDGNIGVLLGNGLVTIDLDQDKAVEPFLNLNSKVRHTLRTRRKRGCNLWLRITGPYPESCKLKRKSGEDFGEWRADGKQTVIHGEAIDRKKGETKPTAYKIENRTPPIELAFDAIHWPDDVILPWRSEPVSSPGVRSIDELRQLYGEPYYTNEIGISLNESFWAGLFDSENIVLWEPSERAFYKYFFVCPTCWKQLPQPHRAAFGALKIKCFSWLREFAPQRNPTSTPQSKTNNQLKGTSP